MRRSPAIVVFFIYFTAAANVLETVGLTDAMGISTGVTASDRLAEAQAAAASVRTGGGFADSLFGIYNAVAATMQAVVAGVGAGPRLLTGAGIPEWAVVFLFAPAAVIVGLDIVYYLSGRD